MDLVEVTARIGDTTIDLAHVAPGGTYRLGTALLVDLGYVVHRPPQVRDWPVLSPALFLAPGMTLDLQVGIVEVQLRRMRPDGPAVPRPPIERRPYPFLALSLAVHLAVWLAALRLAPFERLVPRHRALLGRLQPRQHVPPPPARQEPPPRPTAAHVAADRVPREARPGPHDATPGPRGRVSRRVGTAAHTRSAAADDPTNGPAQLAAAIASIDVAGKVAEVGPVYDEDADLARGFGGRHFDPDSNPEFDTIKAGDYQVFRGPPPPRITLCPPGAVCEATGSVALSAITPRLQHHMASFLWCYHEKVFGQEGDVSVAFTIGRAGRVVTTSGTGLDGVQDCVAKVAFETRFPAAGGETEVRVTLHLAPPVR